MATVQITDVIVPTEFSAYIVENSVEKSALVASGIVARNAAIESIADALAARVIVASPRDSD